MTPKTRLIAVDTIATTIVFQVHSKKLVCVKRST